MPNVLYVGDTPEGVLSEAKYANRDKPNNNWTIAEVPLGPFPRATPDGLGSWLKGEVTGYRPLRRYDAVVVACNYADMVPVVRESLPKRR